MNSLSLSIDTQKAEKYIEYLLCAFVFCLPFSSSGRSIIEVALIGLLLLTPHFRSILKSVFFSPVGRVTFLLMLWIIGTSLYSNAFLQEKLMIFGKYSKLIYFPLFVAAFQIASSRKQVLQTYVIAMSLTCILLLIQSAVGLPIQFEESGGLIHNHIITSYMMDMAIYICLMFQQCEKGFQKRVYQVVFFIMSIYMLFVNTGKMGSLLYFAVITVYALQTYRVFWAKIAIFLSAALMFGAAFKISPVFQTQINKIYTEVTEVKRQEHSSIGLRFAFYAYAKDLILRQPLLGQGVGGFTAAYRQDKPVPAWTKRLIEPHNFYLLILSEFGVLGFLLFSAYFFIMVIPACQHLPYRAFGLATAIIFLIGNLTDSLFFYSSTAYLFMTFIALAYPKPLNALHR